jgi:hypothetical protein
MLRSIAAYASASPSTVETALRCVSKHEGARSSSSFETRVRAVAWGYDLACALLRMRTAARHLNSALLVPAAYFCEDRAGARWIDLVSVLDKRRANHIVLQSWGLAKQNASQF